MGRHRLTIRGKHTHSHPNGLRWLRPRAIKSMCIFLVPPLILRRIRAILESTPLSAHQSLFLKEVTVSFSSIRPMANLQSVLLTYGLFLRAEVGSGRTQWSLYFMVVNALIVPNFRMYPDWVVEYLTRLRHATLPLKIDELDYSKRKIRSLSAQSHPYCDASIRRIRISRR